MDNLLHITFDGPRIAEDGVSLDDFHKTVQHLQTALRHMVMHLAGAQGRTPEWVRNGSILRLKRTFPGSLGAELCLSPPGNTQAPLEDYGQMAIDRIVDWQPANLGKTDHLPPSVTRALRKIHDDVSDEITAIRLIEPGTGRSVLVPRSDGEAQPGRSNDQLSAGPLFGWLNEVNWDRGTAQLHRFGEKHVPLRFGPDLHGDMLRYATQFVEIIGAGRLNKSDQWTSVNVEEIRGPHPWNESMDLQSLVENSSHKTFDPDRVITASEPFDVDEYYQLIKEAREAESGYAPE